MEKTELLDSTSFDYSVLDKDTAQKLRYCANEITKQRFLFATSIMTIGEMLSIAHEQLASKREFQKWIETECGFSKSTAYRYLDAYRVFSSCPNLGRLEDSAMYVLAAKDTPENARIEAIKLTENGQRITHKQALELVKKYQPDPESVETDVEDVEDEPEVVEEEPTLEEICESDNKAIESFCRAIVKQFQEDVPRLPWTEDSGRIESALANLRAGLTTLRSAKAEVCPACVEGRTEKGKCKFCKGHGYLPSYQAKSIPEDARL